VRILATARLCLFTAALTVGFATVPAVADTGKSLTDVETAGLKAAGKKRLRSLITAPKVTPAKAFAAAPEAPTTKRPPKVRFTKDWIDAQPKAKGGPQWRCLSEALYFEARGESVKGQFAVAEVIMNRVASARFPASLCGVINQGTGKKYQCQFTYTCDGRKEVISEPRAYARVGKIARLIMDGKVPALTEGATHYHTTAVRPNWSRVYKRTARIGTHLFYRHTWRTASN